MAGVAVGATVPFSTTIEIRSAQLAEKSLDLGHLVLPLIVSNNPPVELSTKLINMHSFLLKV
jgi:hypothetical protein